MRKEFFEGMRKVRHATNLRQCLVIFVVKISYVLLSAAALCLCVLSTAPSFSIDGEKEKVLFYRHLASPRFVRFRRVGRDVSSDSLDYLDPAPGLTNFGPGHSRRKVPLKHVVFQFHFSCWRLFGKETSSRSREASEGSLHYFPVNRFSCLCTCLCGCISRACRRVAFDRGALSPRFSCVWSLFCYVC